MRAGSWFLFCVCGFLAAGGVARAAGRLSVADAWIRAAPPGAGMQAGYATLGNDGDAPISILTAQSDDFRDTTLHETAVVDGVSKMRELHRVDIAPGAKVTFAPGGKHVMLTLPRRDVVVGDKVEVTFLLADGTRVESYFDVIAADGSRGD